MIPMQMRTERADGEGSRARTVAWVTIRFGAFVLFVAGSQLLSGDASPAGAALLVALGSASGIVLLGGPALVDHLGARPDRENDEIRSVDLARGVCSPQRVLVSRAMHPDADVGDLVPRVRPVVAARLARDHDLDLDDPADHLAIERIVGRNAMTLLGVVRGDAERLPDALDECADFLGVTR